ncbi:DotU family type VI secretion system protein [Proteus mirabilis]|uniref:DotU family type VI secretion system protein n=1 Tax=Proteus mirabilis TaxID=584 RepID=UPI0034D7941E
MQNDFSKTATEQELDPQKNTKLVDNPLVIAANPLLNMIKVIRSQVTQQNPVKLRQMLIDDIRRFEVRGQQEGLSYDVLIGARYCLCTTLDEAVMSTPWGKNTVWSTNGLLVTFHNEGWGGEKFFQLLARLSKQPKKNILLLELINYCLLLGFEGRYHIIDNGYSQLETLKQRLAQIIHSVRGSYSIALSPHPIDTPVEQKSWRPMLPLWVCAIFLGLLLCLWFITLNWRLTEETTPVVSSIYQIDLPSVLSEDISVPLAFSPAVAKMKNQLQRDIVENHLSIRHGSPNSISIILTGDGLFDSASTTINENYQSTLMRIAQALNHINGTITVSGHTDNDRIHNARFPSNYELSFERADTVGTVLKKYLQQPSRVTIEGKGALVPIVPNTSLDNKALNRRVEITVQQMPNTQLPTVIRASQVGDK